MPAHPVADWPEVKATAIATGSFEEAAKLHGIAPATVRQRARREAWPVGPRLHQAAADAVALSRAAIVATQEQRGIVTNVTNGQKVSITAADALAAANADHSRRGRAALLRYGARSAEHLADLDPAEAVLLAPQAASVSKVLATAGDWAAPASGSISINLLSAVSVSIDKEDSIT